MARGEGIRALQAGLLPACAYQVLDKEVIRVLDPETLSTDRIDLAGS
jgi:hypothetical protein